MFHRGMFLQDQVESASAQKRFAPSAIDGGSVLHIVAGKAQNRFYRFNQ